MARRGAVFRYPADFFGTAASGAGTAAHGVATKDVAWAGRESLQNGSRAGEKRNMNVLKSADICSPMGAEKRNN